MNFKKIALVLPAMCLLVGPASWGSGITGPFMYDSALVLPKGVRNLLLQGVTTEAENSFNEVSSGVPMGNSFNQSVSANDLLKPLSANEQAEYGGYLKANNINPDASLGDAGGAVAARVTVSVPALAYGVSDKWTVGIAVPIVYSDLSVSTGFVANSNFNETMAKIAKDDNPAARNVGLKVQNLIQYEAQLKGYDHIDNETTKTEMGDVNLISKYQFVKTEDYAFALTDSLILPTGRRANINKVVDIGSGDGDFKLGVGTVGDWYVHHRITLSGVVAYLAQLPDQLPLRLPNDRNDTLSSDIDPTVYRDLGDIVRTGAVVRFAANSQWTLLTAWMYQYKMADRYRGAAYDSFRYDLMSEKTEQTMQSAQVGLAFNTIAMYQRKKFAAPLEAGLNYTTIYDGRNVTRDSLTSLDLSMYF